jgi:hypothetical protein
MNYNDLTEGMLVLHTNQQLDEQPRQQQQQHPGQSFAPGTPQKSPERGAI